MTETAVIVSERKNNMKYYKITLVDGAPNWDDIPVLNVDERPWTPETDIKMVQQLCYDENGIYIHQRAWEREIRAEGTELLSRVCEDSCMEFFFAPVPEDGRYFNIEFNPNGCVHLGFGHGRHDSIRLIPHDIKELFGVEANRLDDGWELFYKIPLTFIQQFYPGYELKSGRMLHANCYKCGDKTAAPHYLLWNPSTSDTPDYHRPQDFGVMELA